MAKNQTKQNEQLKQAQKLAMLFNAHLQVMNKQK